MTYRLVQLAPGSYDVERNGEVVASLVQSLNRGRWYAELLDGTAPPPPPFTAPEHRFRNLTIAREWLGNPEVVHTPGGDLARGTI